MSDAPVELLRAAAAGDLNRLSALLTQGVDVNSTNKANQTALMLAAAFKRIEIVKYLVLAGADVTVQDEQGLTASDWAQDDTRILTLLNTPDVNDVDHTAAAASTPLAPSSWNDRPTRSFENKSKILHTAVGRSFWSFLENDSLWLLRARRAGPKSLRRASRESASHNYAPSKDLKNLHTAVWRIFFHSFPQWVQTVLRKIARRVNIPLPQLPPLSPAIRMLFRVSIIVLLFVWAYGTYHFWTSLVSTRTASGVKLESALLPVNAATKPTKSAPTVGGDVTGTELFLPDAEYPPDATVASGNITVAIQVSWKGIVVKAEALSGDESLRGAAEKAAMSSAFAPDKLKDKGLLIDGTITYNFLKPNVKTHPPTQDFGFITDMSPRENVSASAGGPLAGAERKLVIPKIPKSIRVKQESATVVVRVNRKGKVMSWRPLDGEAGLREYLIKAARTSTFNAAKLPGEDNVVGYITYRFQ